MASSLPIENLDRTNLASWSYKMHQYLLGHGYWSYVDGEQLLSYVRDAQTPKGAWENLKKVFATSTTARKLQLRQELSNLRQRDLSVADYTSKIKYIYDSLASIEVNIEESEMVQICLGGLASKFGVFRTAVCTLLLIVLNPSLFQQEYLIVLIVLVSKSIEQI